MASLVQQLDQQLMELLSGWNVYSTVFAAGLVALVGYIIFSAQDPDVHPLILLRQSSVGAVRNPGESAVYRSPDVPPGYPLRTGLQVKSPGDRPYAAGRDGDLRDVWRRVTGEIPLAPSHGTTPSGSGQGNIMTVFGKEEVVNHNIEELTTEIQVIGSYIQKHGGKRVAIYLPNSIEFLCALFACAFYGLDAVLLPYNQPHAAVVDLLQRTKADCLIAEAGSIPLDLISKKHKTLTQLVWVVEKTSRHMDWTEVPEGQGGKIDVSVWHELVQENQNMGKTAFPDIMTEKLGKIITVWQSQPVSGGDIVEFTHQNLVAAISALIAALPARQRINSSDTLLAIDSFTDTYPLCLALAALFCHASLALTSVAGPAADLTFAAKMITPTLVVSSAESAAKLQADVSSRLSGGIPKLAYYSQSRALEAGYMPGDSMLTQIGNPTRAAIGSTPGKLRVLFVSEKAGTASPPLSSQDLCDLRIFTGARLVYALTTAKVAGAVAQTNIFDYRKHGSKPNKHSHFGVPLGSVEVKLVDTAEHKTTDNSVQGHIVVSGPAVSGNTANLEILGAIRDDGVLAYL